MNGAVDTRLEGGQRHLQGVGTRRVLTIWTIAPAQLVVYTSYEARLRFVFSYSLSRSKFLGRFPYLVSFVRCATPWQKRWGGGLAEREGHPYRC